MKSRWFVGESKGGRDDQVLDQVLPLPVVGNHADVLDSLVARLDGSWTIPKGMY